ncbi:hypothetical protein [Streptomyces sp. NPDC019507]|uniref:hypothetical protein n=1 Tax=Streptomyces sp. NPDC019507 TaxID=3154689 RepID=UPI00340C387C
MAGQLRQLLARAFTDDEISFAFDAEVAELHEENAMRYPALVRRRRRTSGGAVR